MAYFTPLQYSPTPQPHELANLFDVVNKLGVNPMVTGEEFGNAPQYSPFAETRADFTTTRPSYYNSDQDGTLLEILLTNRDTLTHDLGI